MNTNELTRRITNLLRPEAALIAYSSDELGRYYVELREITPDGRMSEGRPVTVDFMRNLVKEFSVERSTTPHGRIPENMIWADTRIGHEKYIWYNPPRRRMMYFQASLGIENAEYNLPGVIYRINKGHMDIYSYKDKVLTPETKLYRAPFFNVSGFSVCLGRASLKTPSDMTYENLIEYWEKKFWLTEFSHLGGQGNPTKSNLVLVTKAARDTPFDLDQLVCLNDMKLKDILK